MKKFVYNREKTELLRVMKAKAEKQKIQISESGRKIKVYLKTGEFSDGEDAVPVVFEGKIDGKEDRCTVEGRFQYGFNLTALVIVAAILIVARFLWSVLQQQWNNVALCGIAMVLLFAVMLIVHTKSGVAKKIIEDFLSNLNKR